MNSSSITNAPIKSVAVIGGGPAGATTAAYLAMAGLRVGIFMDRKRPDLLIGESLIPGVIPILDELGVEEEISRIGTYKPGATIYFTPEFEETFFFNVLEGPLHQYAFNVPRDAFDSILLDNAVRKGATLFPFIAKIDADIASDTVRLSAETLGRIDNFFDGGQPDFIVDCSGRSRLFARALQIKEQLGPRKDTALFAHRDKASIVRRGNIHMSVIPEGWSWRIPLPGKVSVGIVAAPEYFEKFGDDATEQYDRALAEDPILAPTVAGSSRTTRVMKYNNYQLTSDRMHGANWAMVGDAAGFIDPVFSSGLCVSLTGAQDLVSTLLKQGTAALPSYEVRVKEHLSAWRTIVDSFYDQDFFRMAKQSREMQKSDRKSRVHQWYRVQVSRVISGVEIRDQDLMDTYTSLLSDVRALQSPSPL